MSLTDTTLPGLFQAADQAAVVAQRQYLRATGLRLLLLAVAAASGAASLRFGDPPLDAAAMVTVLALVAAALLEIWLLVEKPELTWYDGRALAESAKTIAWRYAVAGAPFRKRAEEPANERMAVEELTKLLHDAPATKIAPSTAPAISQAMRDLRAADLPERKRRYLESRLADQQQWYTQRARRNQRRAASWRIAILAAEFLAVVAALLRALGVVQLDLAGIAATMVAAGAAWLAVKQHEALGRAYSFAANELTIIATRLQATQDEDAWADEVGDAEEAISREHTMWRASRSTLR
ncbi:MAG TPA: DUF4231 domain-containing protein [Micromonosporaceae bacterium]|nr:DUF4231 domain-containing protein [Micromonosporaceae bacterium]